MADLRSDCVFDRGLGVVDGAGADEDEQTRIAMSEDARDGQTGVEDSSDSVVGDGAFFLQKHGREDHLGPLDAKIFNARVHGRNWFQINSWGRRIERPKAPRFNR